MKHSSNCEQRCVTCPFLLCKHPQRSVNEPQEFPAIAEKLRASEVRVQKLKLQPFSKWPSDMQESYYKATDVAEINWSLSNKEFPAELSILTRRLRLRNRPEDFLIRYRDKKPPWLPVPRANPLPWFTRTYDELVDCDILMDPVRTGFDVEKGGKMKYYVPRVVVGRNNQGPPGWRTRKPFRTPRKLPSPPQARPLSTIVRICETANRFCIPRIPFG